MVRKVQAEEKHDCFEYLDRGLIIGPNSCQDRGLFMGRKRLRVRIMQDLMT